MRFANALQRFVVRTGLSIALGAGVAGTAVANDWYVDINAPAGGDGSQAHPYQRIKNALTSSSDGDRILVSPGTYPELLTIKTNVSILGQQGATTTISALPMHGTPLIVSSGKEVWLQDLRVVGRSGYYGGGFHNSGTAVVVRCRVQGYSTSGGGGVFNDGTMVMWDCVVDHCTSEGAPGGGIWNAGTLKLFNCTVNDNVASAPAIYGGGGVAYGGGIYSSSAPVTPDVSDLRLVNVTISKNTAQGDRFMTPGSSFGGGVYALGKVSIDHSTIADNEAEASYYGYSGDGGGFYGVAADVTHSIFAFNVNDDFDGVCNSGGYLLIRDVTDTIFQGDMTGVQTGVDPKLLPLANNGGFVQTRALDLTSPCIDTGNPDPLVSPAYDARSYPRALWDPTTGVCDLGAYEYGAAPSFLLTATPDLPLPAGATVALTTGGGIYTHPNLVVLVAVNGAPTFSPLLINTFDQSGVILIEGSVPNGLSGTTAGMRSWSLDANGKLEISNEVVLTLQ